MTTYEENGHWWVRIKTSPVIMYETGPVGPFLKPPIIWRRWFNGDFENILLLHDELATDIHRTAHILCCPSGNEIIINSLSSLMDIPQEQVSLEYKDGEWHSVRARKAEPFWPKVKQVLGI